MAVHWTFSVPELCAGYSFTKREKLSYIVCPELFSFFCCGIETGIEHCFLILVLYKSLKFWYCNSWSLNPAPHWYFLLTFIHIIEFSHILHRPRVFYKHSMSPPPLTTLFSTGHREQSRQKSLVWWYGWVRKVWRKWGKVRPDRIHMTT